MDVDFEDLKWNVAHDPCRTGDRAPIGAVAAGTGVDVVLRVSPKARDALAQVRVIVRGKMASAESSAVHEVRMEGCAIGFEAHLAFADEPQVAFYLFELRLVDGVTLLYAPACDGRSTAGELVRPGVDGELADGLWWPAGWRLASRPAGELGLAPPPAGFQVTLYEPAFTTPQWLAGAVMYQVFPDRFARGSGGVRGEGLAYHARMGRPVRLHEAWDEPVEWTGDVDPTVGADPAAGADVDAPADAEVCSAAGAAAAAGTEPGIGAELGCAPDSAGGDDGLLRAMRAYDPIDFFGGTLDGIREKLDYLADLGVEALYLNPIFEARSNHRYDTADYERIDPLLGDTESFARLAHEASERGIRLVLDAVLSHTGNDSRYFNAQGAYPGPGAMQGDASPYRSWYDFTPHASGTPYRSWWGDPTLPEVDERDPSWQRYLLGAPDARAEGGERAEGALPSLLEASGSPGDAGAFSPLDALAHEDDLEATGGAFARGVLPTWLSRGAGGFRLDVADEIPDDVLELVRASVKGANSQAVIIGEVWEDPTTKESYGARRRYALGTALDSVMNYPLRGALLGFALGHLDAHRLVTFLKLQQANYPGPLYRCCMNLLGSHDVERLRTVLALGGTVKHLPRNEQLAAVSAVTPEQDACGARLQQMVVGLLYALPGAPCLYYGDERGLQGGGDPFCRATFPWDDELQLAGGFKVGGYGRAAADEPANRVASGGRGDCGIDLTALYRRLGKLRKASRVLRAGELACVAPLPSVACVVRVDSGSGQVIIAAANCGDESVRVAFDALSPELGLSAAARDAIVAAVGSWKVLIGDAASARAAGESGVVTLEVPALATVYFAGERPVS